MNIVETLKRQHEEVRDILERMIAEDDRREARVLLDQLSLALRLHMQIEEKMVYPAASRAFSGDEDDEETVLESFEEHAVARRCLETLEATLPSDKRFVVRAKVLKQILETHIEEEENDLFPELEGKLGLSGIEKLGEQITRRMSQLEADAKAGPAKGQKAPRSPRGRGVAAARTARTGRAASGGRGRIRGAKASAAKSSARAKRRRTPSRAR